MGYFSESFLNVAKQMLSPVREEKQTPADILHSWSSGGDIISQIASHSTSHNYAKKNSDVVVAHEKMRDEGISHMERLHAMAKDPVDKTSAADAINHLRNAKVVPSAYPKITIDRYK